MSMKPTLVYIYPDPHIHPGFRDNAWRFIGSYLTCPPGTDHDTIVICNGFQPTTETHLMFGQMPNLTLMAHDNSGWDIGAFQMVSSVIGKGLVLFVGNTAFFGRPGWMRRVVESFQAKGSTLYGSMSNTGNWTLSVNPHIRTTGFWIPAELLNQYPHRVNHHTQRYEFEHGMTCLTNWIKGLGKIPWTVTFNGEYSPPYWGNIPNGFQRGNQSALVVRDRLTEPPYYDETNSDILSLPVPPRHTAEFGGQGGGHRF